MVFSSYVFLFYFLPIALGTYYATPQRWRQVHLTLFSYVFYGWWNPWFILLMLFSTAVDYGCGRLILGQWRIPWLHTAKRSRKSTRFLPSTVPRHMRHCCAGVTTWMA